MDVLVVEQVRGLKKALVTQVALEGAVGRGLMRATVAHQRVLLLKAHLTVLAVIGSLLRVRALVLAKVRRPLEALPARCAAEWSCTLRLACVVQQFRRFFEVQLTQVALEKVLTRMGVHVPNQVGAVLEGFLAHSTLVWPLRTVRAVVMLEVRHLAEALIARLTFVRLLPGVDSLVARQLGQMTEALRTH